ncbi:MAG: hypothetical protein GX495_07445 [Chloroflexi bacterium]|nr:hypothetical protein [Chloroflexota bacterium]
MDAYISRSLKNWAARQQPSKKIRSQLLAQAASDSYQMVEPYYPPQLKPFNHTLLDGSFGPLILANIHSFNMTTMSLRMI